MRRSTYLFWGLVVGAAAVLGLDRVAAQQAPDAEARILQIRELTGLGRRARVATPRYTVNVPGGRGRAVEWVQLGVEYDTAPEWIDQLSFQYYALLLKETRGGPREFSLLRGGETCMDIAAGKRHMSTVYIRPTAVPRYGEVVAVAVEVTHKGSVVESLDIKSIDLPPNWWKDSRLTARDGYVLDRSKTPFWFVNFDDYEQLVH